MNSFIIFSSKYIIYIVGLIAVFVTLRSERAVRNRLIMLAVLSLLVAFGIASLGGLLYFDPRPFTVTHTTPLIPHLPDDGFPSDHTLYAMAAAATVFCYWRKTGILLGVLAVLTGTARVLAGVHHPVDIIGGAMMAITAVSIAWFLLKGLARVKPFARMLSI